MKGKVGIAVYAYLGTTDRTTRSLKAPEGFIIMNQKKVWMDEVLMQRWIKEIWMKYMKEIHDGESTECESILCLDSFSAHTSEAVAAEFERQKVHTIVIPGGCTSVLQPLDVSLNKPLKSILHRHWQQYVFDKTAELEAARATSEDPRQFSKVSPPSRQTLVDWIVDVWQEISYKCVAIAKSFFVTGISNALGTWEETLIRNDNLRAEIDDIMAEVFGSTPLSNTDTDPLASSESETDSDSEPGSEVEDSAGSDSDDPCSVLSRILQ